LLISINYQIRYFKRNCKPIILYYKTFRERAKKIKYKANETIIDDADEFFDASKIKRDDYKRASVVEEVLFENYGFRYSNYIEMGIVKINDKT
jgi:hypothetical protein